MSLALTVILLWTVFILIFLVLVTELYILLDFCWGLMGVSGFLVNAL